MNKYQEALDFFRKCICEDGEKCEDCDINHSCDFQINIEKHHKTLQELIDKATPKKAIKDEPSKTRYVQTYKCPNCQGVFSGEISRYCYHCGQALDWSDE